MNRLLYRKRQSEAPPDLEGWQGVCRWRCTAGCPFRGAGSALPGWMRECSRWRNPPKCRR
jgi:hypothetical protein